MLRRLYIKNFTLIDSLDIEFHSGFSVITGETGAGKSIILGAVNMLLGQRSDVKTIRQGETSSIIEAHFDITGYGLKDFFDYNDIEYDEKDCILRREINVSGKSRCFINDTPEQLSLMRELGNRLVDIHSQHQNLVLSQEDFQLYMVDTIANNKEKLQNYSSCFKQYQAIKRKISILLEETKKAKLHEDYLLFLIEELKQANLSEDIQQELENEREKLSHVEDIKTVLYSTEAALNSSDSSLGVVDKLKEISRWFNHLKTIYNDISPLLERIESVYVELKDISREVDSLVNDVDFDPRRLEKVNQELDKIYSLEKKYSVSSTKELIELELSVEDQLSKINNSEEELQSLEKEEKQYKENLETLSKELTLKRKSAAIEIEKELSKTLKSLGIENVNFSIKIETKELSISGGDSVTFLFSANKSSPLQPLSQVASGGEISRVMLALKAMISRRECMPTIIFDEIDTGVGGKIAEKMANIMEEMIDENHQVISITHLPQIASKASYHYKVEKKETNKGTQTLLRLLDKEERIKEIAQMLSGSTVSSAAMDNARELLKF